jgi:2-oxoisovalerate dehydrogenase E1 component alpha subunit
LGHLIAAWSAIRPIRSGLELGVYCLEPAAEVRNMSKRSPLSLHVPEPEFRPGSRPDFSGVTIPKAGSVRRPSVDVAPEEVRDLGYSIIRVLNRAGEAVGPWSGELSDEAFSTGSRP